MNSTWNEEYYEIIDFYHWEPNHLGMQLIPQSSFQGIEDILKNIKRKEVPLNHQMNIFFRLVPNTFLRELIRSFFDQENDDQFEFHGNRQWRMYATEHDPTQPDIFLNGRRSNIAIELKVKAKSNVDQVVKYLLLHYLNEGYSSTQKQFFFLYLSPGGFSNLWRPSIRNREELDELVRHYDFQEIEKKTKYLGNVNWDDVLAVWQRTYFSARSYAEFHSLLLSYRQNIRRYCPSNETLQKLLDGMINELELRHLASVQK